MAVALGGLLWRQIAALSARVDTLEVRPLGLGDDPATFLPCSRSPSARTPAGRTPGRSAASRPGSTAGSPALVVELAEVRGEGGVLEATAVAAACFRARLPGRPSPAGERTARPRRSGRGLGRVHGVPAVFDRERPGQTQPRPVGVLSAPPPGLDSGSPPSAVTAPRSTTTSSGFGSTFPPRARAPRQPPRCGPAQPREAGVHHAAGYDLKCCVICG